MTHRKVAQFLDERAKREIAEQRDPNHPRQFVSPETEIKRTMEAQPRAADHDEIQRMFNPDFSPLIPDGKEEGVTDENGRLKPIETEYGSSRDSFRNLSESVFVENIPDDPQFTPQDEKSLFERLSDVKIL